MKTARHVFMAAAFMAFAASASAQSAIPVGTILPVRLNTSLSKAKPGQIITARIMQDVPLPDGAKIPEGAKVFGRVIAATSAAGGANAEISFEFDRVVFSRRTIPVTTNLRAMASFMDVNEAQIPLEGPDRGTPETAWTTRQVGGDVVYRGGGPVSEGNLDVGRPVYNGVLAPAIAAPGTECRADIGGNDRPQALWVFSADACGTYGFRHLQIAHASRTDPLGQITLASDNDKLSVPAGTGMLLRVVAGKAST